MASPSPSWLSKNLILLRLTGYWQRGIGEHAGLVREASKISGGVQRSIDALTAQLARGNLNPGIGTKHLAGDIFYARSRDGARVFFRHSGDDIEVLAKATKQNEARVINMLQETYK